jgi:hypothetical protein
VKLTKEKLYRLIAEQMKRFYQAPRPMKKRLMDDPNVDRPMAMKLYRMLDSEDEEDQEQAAELMAAMGIGEFGKDDEDITKMTVDIEDDKERSKPMYNFNVDQELDITVKERFRLRQIASAAKNMTHVVQILDKQAEKAKRDFRRLLPFFVDSEDLQKKRAAEDVMEFMEKVIDVFYNKVEIMFKDLEDTNFMVYDSYNDKLSKYMLEYFDDIAKGRKQMEPI